MDEPVPQGPDGMQRDKATSPKTGQDKKEFEVPFQAQTRQALFRGRSFLERPRDIAFHWFMETKVCFLKI